MKAEQLCKTKGLLLAQNVRGSILICAGIAIVSISGCCDLGILHKSDDIVRAGQCLPKDNLEKQDPSEYNWIEVTGH